MRAQSLRRPSSCPVLSRRSWSVQRVRTSTSVEASSRCPCPNPAREDSIHGNELQRCLPARCREPLLARQQACGRPGRCSSWTATLDGHLHCRALRLRLRRMRHQERQPAANCCCCWSCIVPGKGLPEWIIDQMSAGWRQDGHALQSIECGRVLDAWLAESAVSKLDKIKRRRPVGVVSTERLGSRRVVRAGVECRQPSSPERRVRQCAVDSCSRSRSRSVQLPEGAKAQRRQGGKAARPASRRRQWIAIPNPPARILSYRVDWADDLKCRGAGSLVSSARLSHGYVLGTRQDKTERCPTRKVAAPIAHPPPSQRTCGVRGWQLFAGGRTVTLAAAAARRTRWPTSAIRIDSGSQSCSPSLPSSCPALLPPCRMAPRSAAGR